jgi:hypothetical protein
MYNLKFTLFSLVSALFTKNILAKSSFVKIRIKLKKYVYTF